MQLRSGKLLLLNNRLVDGLLEKVTHLLLLFFIGYSWLHNIMLFQFHLDFHSLKLSEEFGDVPSPVNNLIAAMDETKHCILLSNGEVQSFAVGLD